MRSQTLRLLGMLAWGTLLCCASRQPSVKNPWAPLNARYVSWQPTTDAVPAVHNRGRALEYLAASLELWKKAAYPAYIYSRVRQGGEHEVELTAYQVTEGRVTQRTLVRLNPEELTSSAMNNLAHRTSVWHETERSLGTHEGGFPPMTMEQLYESCRRDVLATHPELPVRMHFDMAGFLQHCGFTPKDCDDCAAVSVQSVAKSDMPASFDLRRNLCTNFDGFASTRNGPSWHYGCDSCRCEPGAEFPEPRKPRRKRPPASEGSSGLQDICDIDPAACPASTKSPDGPWGSWGQWQCMTSLVADCEGPAIPPPIRAPICVGKATPTESNEVAHLRCARAESSARAAVQRAAQ